MGFFNNLPSPIRLFVPMVDITVAFSTQWAKLFKAPDRSFMASGDTDSGFFQILW
jgi:hypothetical protein